MTVSNGLVEFRVGLAKLLADHHVSDHLTEVEFLLFELKIASLAVDFVEEVSLMIGEVLPKVKS